MKLNEGTRQKKHSCDNCPAHNRGVREVVFRKNKLHLCQECSLIASRIAKAEAKSKETSVEQIAAPIPEQKLLAA